jgi:hypothetical protein
LIDMSEPDAGAMAGFLRKQYDLWNEGKRVELIELFRKMAPKGFTIEYVGTPVQDGWKAMDAIWDEHGGHVKIEVLEILVNGNEAAVHALNHHLEKDGHIDTRGSIEIYRFTGGTLHARYFYPTSA